MRIIHTSDWHLGQNFYTKSRADEHLAFLEWLISQVNAHQVDAVIVAGDLFDSGSPPSYAREIYNHFVVALQRTGCQLIILAGNHDAVSTLNESRELLACLNTLVVAKPEYHSQQQAHIIPDRQGAPGAIICPIPYLRPRDILSSQAGLDGQQKQRALQDAIIDYYQSCFRAAKQCRGERDLPIIMTGHLTTVGAQTSDSVRDIYIGTLEAFPASGFPDADYIALGHIHRAQRIANSEHIRYSGSPIALSFDEVGKEKSVFLVTFDGPTLTQIEALKIPVSQPMKTLKGAVADIQQQLEQWRNAPASPITWLDIEVTTEEYLNDLQRQIQQMAEGLPVEILLIRRSHSQRARILESSRKETLSELSVEDVFNRRISQEPLEDSQRLRLETLFRQTLASLNEED